MDSREAEIKQIRKDADLLWRIKENLILEGRVFDSPGVRMVDDRLWVLSVRMYILIEKIPAKEQNSWENSEFI